MNNLFFTTNASSKWLIATILLFIAFIQHSIAQNKFYIKPLVETKASSTSYLTRNYKPSYPTQYYDFERMKLVMPEGFSPLNIGLSVGYNFNKKLGVELGIAQDEAGSGIRFNFKTQGDPLYHKNPYYYNNAGSFTGGSAGRKIPLLVYYKLISGDSLKPGKKVQCSLSLFGGIGFYSEPPISSRTGIGMDSLIITRDTYMSYMIDCYTINNKAMLYILGLSGDIRYKGKNICTLSLYYEYGGYKGAHSGIVSTQVLNVLIEKPNSQEKYTNAVYSRGSGFLFQLSRKIYWKDFKKKENKLK